MKACKPQVPLIVYKAGWMGEQEIKDLRKRREWYTIANNPITLVSPVHSLAHIFADQTNRT